MRKIASAVLLLFFPLLFTGEVALGATFSSCSETVGSEKAVSSEDYSTLAIRIGQTFQDTLGDGLHDIAINLDCLEGRKNKDSDLCGDRLDYFLKTIPPRWSAYRRIVALSSYSPRFLSLKDRRRAYNFELRSSSFATAAKVDPSNLQQLQEDELLATDREWEIQWNLAKKTVLSEIESRLARPSGAGTVEAARLRDLRQAKTLLEDWPMHMIARSQNPWAQKVFHDIDAIFFRLNRKRTIQLLGRFPILAHLTENEVSRDAIVRALHRQREQLNTEALRVSGILNDLREKADPGISAVDLQSLFDYHFIVDLTTSRHPELCHIANNAFQKIERQSQVKSAVIIVAMIGISPFVPMSWTLFGATAMQSVALHSAYQKEHSTKNLAYGFSSPDLAPLNAEDMYLDRSAVETEWMMAASIVTGLPLMRLSALAIRSLPALKQGLGN